MATRGPGERAGLTGAAVLDAARDLLAESGLAGVTMRALARRLDVAPNALYSHVPGKTELVDALLDDLLAGIPVPEADAPDPVAAVAEVMTATYDALVGRPELVPPMLARQGARGESAVRLGAAMDALLARAGVDADAVPQARRTLIVHAIGSAAYATGADGDRPRARDATFHAGLRWLLSGMTAG